MKNKEAVRKELQRVRDQLSQRLQRLREDADHRAQPLSSDSGDRAQEQENDEVLSSLEKSTVSLLRQYDRALARLAAGRYGICESCGAPIEEARLESMPQTTQCRDCVETVPVL